VPLSFEAGLTRKGQLFIMSQTIFKMAGARDPFARIPNELLSDARLSWKAKGILSYLCGKPDGWKMRVSDIAKQSTDGKHAIRAALNELRALGYAEYIQPRVKGVFDSGCWKVSDTAIFSPRSGFPHADNPDAENRHHSKKEHTKKELSKKESLKKSKEDIGDADGNIFEEIPTTWKPDMRTKEDKLKTMKVPDYPSQREFDSFVASEPLKNVDEFRENLYSDLCNRKWHHWRPALNKWIPIRDWRSYVTALDVKMERANACKP